MIPEIGNFALMLATAVALVLGTLPIVGAARGNLRWMAMARPAAPAPGCATTSVAVESGWPPRARLSASAASGGM